VDLRRATLRAGEHLLLKRPCSIPIANSRIGEKALARDKQPDLCARAATTCLFFLWNNSFDSRPSLSHASLAKPGRTGIFESKQF
jgi:hypothetical protein